MKSFHLDKIILEALREDAYNQDITTEYFVPKNRVSRGYIVVKEDAVVCGLDIARKVFTKLDKNCKFTSTYKDGTRVKKGTKIAFLSGRTRALLTGERTALNFLAHLSGIATKTRTFLDKVRPFKVQILDTRKTTPGLRALEKYAVRCGGGINHRCDLGAMILVKDNHGKIFHGYKNLCAAIEKIKKIMKKPIQVEVEDLVQLKEVLKVSPDLILLDNMSPAQLKIAVRTARKIFPRGAPILEASGGVSLKNIRGIARTGVDRISIGALTHSAKAINMSMELLN